MPTTDDWFREVVERMADVVCAVDRNAVVVYANPATASATGISAEQLLGRSCLEFVHPDDLDRAAESLAYGAGSERVEVPVAFRFRTPDGWRLFDVRGHGLGTDPRGTTSLIVAREAGGFEELDTLLDAMSGGASDALVRSLVARHGVRALWENQIAVLVWRDHEVEVADSGLDDRLQRLLRLPGDWPWTRARRRRGVEGGVLEMLSDDLAEHCRAVGFGAVYAVPVSDPLTALDAALVSFGPGWLRPNLGYGFTLQRCARLLRISEQQRHQREFLEHSARSDPLTGIPNRRRLLHRLEDLLTDHDQGTLSELCVVYGDLDDFKPVNDRFGHAAGDTVLRTVATRLVEAAGRDGVAARLGGDEFAVVATGSPSALVERIRTAVGQPIELAGGVTVTVTMSLGATQARIGDAASTLLELADRECYADKRARGIHGAP